MRKMLLLLCFCITAMQLFAQNRTVTGNVTDDNGSPLTGVTITVPSTNLFTISRTDGAFSISVPSSARQLAFSYVGYATQTVSIERLNTVTVSLVTSATNLEDVVVTGYARIKRSEYSGATTKVEKEKINFVPNASFDQILQGRSPGLLVTVGSGQPGSAARVQIRGASSITGGNSPLYVVDGVPVEDANFLSLNPDDFETIDVLRDAVATAQYGNRGSSGVIVITTKRGKAGKPVLNYSTQFGITEAGEQKFDIMTTSELLQYQEILGQFVNNNLPGWFYSNKNPRYATLSPGEQAAADSYLDSLRGINTDWRDVFLRQGKFQSHDLNLSGGTENTRFFISGGYYDEDGIGLRSDLRRYSFRANLDHRSDKLTVSLSSGVGYTKSNFIESENSITLANSFAAAYLGLPYQKLFNENGTVATGSGKVGPNAYDRLLNGTAFNDNQLKTVLSAKVNYDITHSIYVGGSAGLDYRQTVNERSVYPNSYAANNSQFPGSTGSYRTGYDNAFEYIVRAIAGYKKIFAEKHDVDVQLISEYTRDYLKAFNYTGYGINPKLLNTPAGITPGTPGDNGNGLIPAVGGSKAERTLYAAMILGKYSYMGKYILNASFRRDGSSQLPEKNRYQNFYAAGVTWNVLKENFASGWRVMNDLRLRVSYGTAANADNFPQGFYGYFASYGSGSYAGQQTTVPDNAGNPDLKWEKIQTTNIGLDVAAFKNRLRLTADVYEKKGVDNLVDQKLPLETGFRSQTINAATVSNKGVEVALSGDVLKGRDFVWTVGGNVSYNKNKVEDLGQVKEFEQGTEIVRVGLPIGSHYIVKWGGVDAATGRPLYYAKDGKLTSNYSDDDRVADFGTFNAPWIGGFNTDISFKGVTISALFTFQSGFKRFNNQDFFQLNHAFALQGFNVRRDMLNMWTAPGQVTNIQGAEYQRQFTSKDIQDASYLRFRNVTVAYNFSERILSHLRILGAARFYVQAQNLYTWTNWVGFDPEDDNNIASYEYPTPRTLTVGVNVTFK